MAHIILVYCTDCTPKSPKLNSHCSVCSVHWLPLGSHHVQSVFTRVILINMAPPRKESGRAIFRLEKETKDYSVV